MWNEACRASPQTCTLPLIMFMIGRKWRNSAQKVKKKRRPPEGDIHIYLSTYQFIISGFGTGKQDAPSAQMFACAPDSRDPLATSFPPLPPSMGTKRGSCLRPWGGVRMPYGGFHGETVAEDEKEELKKQKKEERRKSQEITRDQEEAV
nr:uncharacterized protein LOC129479694 isoform X4 [Symphalangus syndactylus]